MNIAECCAKRILYLCKERNITVNRLAGISGLTQSTVDSIINGKSKNPGIITLKKICQGLNISLSEFFNDPSFEDSE
ncbi:helix-turn-helix domain-containing protein [Anaerobacterium chartisolvens]|uniref:helix-turn-helix domain-containing protein n=1 Tax=Anaerobacterium chartisolvens TaxID=1297424 RepID=UPI001FA89D42|nr:helix-turn-helix transcriptional regulator [Anaerobacterium chartisolvens]